MTSSSMRTVALIGGAVAVGGAVLLLLSKNRSTKGAGKQDTKAASSDKSSSVKQPLDSETQQAVEKCIALATSVKQKGNVYLQANKLEEALTVYQQGLDLLSHIPPAASKEAHATRLVIGSNCVLCLLKMESFNAALMLATDLLQDPTAGSGDDDIMKASPMAREMISKILFRRAQALERLGQTDAAVSDLSAAQQLTQNAASKDEIAKKLLAVQKSQ
jgi:tetratricopeptide (TPR) repeat protein